MESGPITSWQIYGETMETGMDFFFLGAQITANGDYSKHQKMLSPWKKSYDKCRQHIKKRRYYFPNKVYLGKAMVFPVVMFGCEIWTRKKAEQ